MFPHRKNLCGKGMGKKMKKLVRVLVLILLCGLFVILCGGLALGMYYRNNFPVNTWINGVYCTGKTIEQVNGELIAQTEISDITVLDADGAEWLLNAEAVELRPDYTAALKAYLRRNSTAMWMENLHKSVDAELEGIQYSWNDEMLREGFEQLGFVREESGRTDGCLVQFSGEEGFFLYDGNSERLNSAKALSYVQACLSGGKLYIDLRESSCYENLEDSARDVSQRQLWSQLQDFFDCKLTYDMGTEQIPLSPDILSTFLKTDENRNLLLDEKGFIVVDEELVGQWVEELAELYNTCDTTREFQATRGDVVSVKYSTYGTRLDTETEKEYLINALKEERLQEELHIPAYSQEGFVRGLDDIGDTYIEVDMTEQHMYYYVDGELVLDTDVVTGNTGRRMGTPEGINFVYNKQRDRILRGADYATPVKYWVPVKGAVGIHDADWRKEFGGEIYKRNGSHGCINTPPDIMAELYEMVEIGTPVIMFY